MTTASHTTNLLRQPRAVWAVAFACVVAFMGIGLVDPILPAIASQLDASPSQVELLFTSYFAVTGVSMLVTGFVSSRVGPRRTLLCGLALVVVFSALAGASGSVGEIVGFRAGWGLGNALFIATALSVIIGSASGVSGAIILYEAALGLGTAALMAVGFIAIVALLRDVPAAARRASLADPLRALRHRGLLVCALIALFYNFGFFTMPAYTPFPLHLGAHALGFVFFGWGLALAITSVFVAPLLTRRLGARVTLGVALALVALDLAAMAAGAESRTALIAGVVAAGALLGVVNTVLTEAVMRVSPVERPVASAAYSFVRFAGGAVAPYLAGRLAEDVGTAVPFVVGAGAVLVAVVVLILGRRRLAAVEPGVAKDLLKLPMPADAETVAAAA